MKRLAVMILLLCMVCMAVTAHGEVAFSRRALCEHEAYAALLEKYGLTGGMHTYFHWTFVENEDGTALVRAEGISTLNYVLGNYEVFFDGNEMKDVSWSHDGASTEGMFEAEAWGCDQMRAMMEQVSQTYDAEEFFDLAQEIAEKYQAPMGPDYSDRILGDDALAMHPEAFVQRTEEVLSLTDLSEEDFEEIAIEAVESMFVLSQHQADDIEDPMEGNLYGAYLDGEPVVIVWLGAGYGEEDHAWMEGDGTYFVAMDAQNGMVITIAYECGLSANG
ncbi:MAG: hypothetical protein IJ246_02855 [Clostridia bacterium]|nr:hypothetical protein [Clostridia bacterium]